MLIPDLLCLSYWDSFPRPVILKSNGVSKNGPIVPIHISISGKHEIWGCGLLSGRSQPRFGAKKKPIQTYIGMGFLIF
jgi:hypothetical protein